MRSASGQEAGLGSAGLAADDGTFRGEQAAIRALFGAAIEITRRSLPAREVGAAIRALMDAQRAAMKAVTERRQASGAAARERRQGAPKGDGGTSWLPPSQRF